MNGTKFTGRIYVDGKLFTNQLIHGDSDNNKQKLANRMMREYNSVMLPKWLAKHNVELHINDRLTNETIVL